jgi:hypothetical protein
MNRRSFLNGIVGAGFAWSAQRHGLTQSSEAKNFAARLEDVGATAGLIIPTIFGGRTENKYILETTGCGAAFFDYDNEAGKIFS